MNPTTDDPTGRLPHDGLAAFDALVAAYQAPLVRFVTAVLSGDRDAAHDIAQEVFLAAWRSLPTLSDRHRLKAWLYRVAHRRAISWRRRRGPNGAPFLRLDGRLAGSGPSPIEPPSSEAAPDGACARREEVPRLRAALGALPPRYAGPITLTYFESLTTAEVAEILQISRGTLKMRLLRGRRLLRERLGPGASLAREPWVRHRKRPDGPAAPAPPAQASELRPHADSPEGSTP